MNKDEKEKDNFRKSPTKPRSRPRTAPPKGSKKVQTKILHSPLKFSHLKTSRSESARSTPGLVKDVSKTEPDSAGHAGRNDVAVVTVV